METGGARECEKQHGQLVGRAALEGKDIGCGLDVLDTFGAILVLGVLAE